MIRTTLASRSQPPEDGAPVWLRGDSELVGAGRELVRNAARYGKDPGTVRVSIAHVDVVHGAITSTTDAVWTPQR